MPRETITIAGHQFKVQPRYEAGHVLNENEASALNQMRAENIRNNRAAEVKRLAEAGEDMQAYQQEIDKYAEAYEFGVRALGGGGAGARRDPVESEARRMVLNSIKANLREEGLGRTLSSVDKERLEEIVREHVESENAINDQGQTLWEVAKEAVEAKRRRAQMEINVSTLGNAAPKPAPEGESEGVNSEGAVVGKRAPARGGRKAA